MQIEVNEVLNVSPEDFYDYMIDTIIEQIEIDLDVQLNREDIKTGYTHRVRSVDQKSGKTTRTRYTIKDAKRPERFVVVFSTAEHSTKVTYEFKPLENGTKTDIFIHHGKNIWRYSIRTKRMASKILSADNSIPFVALH